MSDPLIALTEAIQTLNKTQTELARAIAELREQMEGDRAETGNKSEAARLLKISPRTLERRIKGTIFIQGIHWWKEGDRLVFDLALLRDWQRNKHQPEVHQRAIEVRRKELLSQRKKRG